MILRKSEMIIIVYTCCRKYIVYISSNRKFHVGISARTFRQETVHDLRKYPERGRLDNAALHAVHNFTVRVKRFHGSKHRFQRGANIVVCRRNNGAPAQGVDGFAGMFVGYDRFADDVRPGIPVRMEDRSADQRRLSRDLYKPRALRTSSQIFSLVLFGPSGFF